jgi:competence protein ComEA
MKKLLLTLCMLFFFAASALAAVNINTADLNTLESLPGIGASKAQAIIDYRTEHGNFKSIDELTNVKGIGDKVLEKIKDQIDIK